MSQMVNIPRVAEKEARSVRAVWQDISTGRFGPDVLRLGRSCRVREEELDAWIAAGCPPRDRWLAIRDRKWRSR